MKFHYITFRSVTHAQRGEKVLKHAGIGCNLLRTPKWMEAQGCGYSLRVWTADIQPGVAALRREGVPMRKVYIQIGVGTLEEMEI